MPEPILTRNVPLIRHAPPHVLETLTDPQFASNGDIATHIARAWERWRILNNTTGEPPTQWAKVVALTDYTTNLAKHPFRHVMRSEVSDARASGIFAANASGLLTIAVENQTWTNGAWVPSPGKTLAADVTPLECTWQHGILGVLCNYIGLHWMLLDITGHTAFAVYVPQFSKWVYVESTFNEHYRWASSTPNNYIPLSPLELHEVSVRGAMGEIVPVLHPYQPQRTAPGGGYYLAPYSQSTPNGWAPMTAHLDGRSVRPRTYTTWRGNREERVLPSGTGPTYFASQITAGWVLDRDPGALFAPVGECHCIRFTANADGVVSVELASTLGGSTGFERSVNGGAWTACAPLDSVRVPAGQTVQWRAVAGQARSGVVEVRRSA